jgi:hypothetical protein
MEYFNMTSDLKKEIERLGMKIARQESDKLHNKQFKRGFKKYEYRDFMNACLRCFIEGYKQRSRI